MQYCFFIASDFTFTTRQIHIWALFPLWPATSSFLELIVLCSSLVACWTLSDMDGELLTFLCHIYLPFHTAHEALGKNTRVHCHFLLQWTIFCQNSSLWPIHLGCPCTIWFVASLSYASLFATRLWSMKGETDCLYPRKPKMFTISILKWLTPNQLAKAYGWR